MNHKFDLYFHIGLPKCASTFLQKEIFPNLNAIKFHEKHKFGEYKDLKKDSLNANHLFSSEKDRNIEEAVVEILKQFPHSKFILVVRRQDEWIMSKYKYHIRKHGWEDFEDFFYLESNKGKIKQEALFFQKKIEFIEKHSESKPLVLIQDLLKSNPDLFVQQITEFTNTTLKPNRRKDRIVNKAFSEKQLVRLRNFNRFYRYKEAKTASLILNRLHYKYREFLLHTMAFFFRFLPGSITAKTPLLKNKNVLHLIRAHYEEDWNYCVRYSKT